MVFYSCRWLDFLQLSSNFFFLQLSLTFLQLSSRLLLFFYSCRRFYSCRCFYSCRRNNRASTALCFQYIFISIYSSMSSDDVYRLYMHSLQLSITSACQVCPEVSNDPCLYSLRKYSILSTAVWFRVKMIDTVFFLF